MKFLAVFLCVAVSMVLGSPLSKTPKQIEDFKTFLEGINDGKYEGPITPEMTELQNEWERSGKYEGDIILTDEDKEQLLNDFTGQRNGLIAESKHWPGKTVYYTFAAGAHTQAQQDAIVKGLNEISAKSCLVFRKRTTQAAYIEVTGKTDGCYSTVGHTGGRQTLNLAPNTPGNGCFRQATIIHEFLHAVGFYHMQSTHNRDDFVRIVWEKIQAGKEHNFNKYTNAQVSNLGVTYDYGSVMHYSEYGFSVDGSKTIVPLKPTSETIGQRVGMSAGDITKLKNMYKC